MKLSGGILSIKLSFFGCVSVGSRFFGRFVVVITSTSFAVEGVVFNLFIFVKNIESR